MNTKGWLGSVVCSLLLMGAMIALFVALLVEVQKTAAAYRTRQEQPRAMEFRRAFRWTP